MSQTAILAGPACQLDSPFLGCRPVAVYCQFGSPVFSVFPVPVLSLWLRFLRYGLRFLPTSFSVFGCHHVLSFGPGCIGFGLRWTYTVCPGFSTSFSPLFLRQYGWAYAKSGSPHVRTDEYQHPESASATSTGLKPKRLVLTSAER